MNCSRSAWRASGLMVSVDIRGSFQWWLDEDGNLVAHDSWFLSVVTFSVSRGGHPLAGRRLGQRADQQNRQLAGGGLGEVQAHHVVQSPANQVDQQRLPVAAEAFIPRVVLQSAGHVGPVDSVGM